MTFPNPFRFARAIWRAFRAKGPVQVDDQTREKRLATCHACPYYDPHYFQCNRCGCFVPLKVELSSESCPEGKWK